MQNVQKRDELYDKYSTILVSILTNFLRATKADNALLNLQKFYFNSVVLSFEESPESSQNLDIVSRTQELIDQERLNILNDIYYKNRVIVIYSIFDSFLSDITKFLLLMNPKSISRERQLKVKDVLESDDLPDLMDKIINKLVHEISYGSIEERIGYLTKTFGVDLSMVRDEISQVQQYSLLRNQLVHSVSIFSYKHSQTDGISIQEIELPSVTGAIVEEIESYCERLMLKISEAVSQHVFQRSTNLVTSAPSDSR